MRLSKPWPGVGQAVARNHDPALHEHRRLDLFGAAIRQIGQQFIANRRRARGRIGGFVHQLEAHLGGLAQDGLEPVGILQARHLHQDAVIALPLDGGLLGAHGIDAPAHHFDRLFQNLLLGLGLVGIGHVQGDHAIGRLGHVIFFGAHRQDRTRDVGIEVGDQGLGFVITRRIGHLDGDGVALGDEIGIADMRLAEGGADIADRGLELVLLHLVELDFEQKIGAALEVQTQTHARVKAARRESG